MTHVSLSTLRQALRGLAGVALVLNALTASSRPAHAVCSNHTPGEGETVTCNTEPPNPDLQGIAGLGFDNVTVDVLPGAGIEAPTVAIDSSGGTGWTVNNSGTVSGANGGGINPGIFLAGGSVFNQVGAEISGHSGIADVTTVVNAGTITGSGGSAIRASQNLTLTLEGTSVLNGDVDELVGDINTLNLRGTNSEDSRFTGFQFVNVVSGASWTLSGDVVSPTDMLTTITGTLRMNGLLAGQDTGSPVEVQPTGRLEGSGTVTGTITNNGTVAPGDGAIGTLFMPAFYTQTTAGTFEVEIEPGGSADLLDLIGGSANLAGTVSVLLAPGDYAPGTLFPILVAGGGVTGAFDTLVQNDPDVPLEVVHGGNLVALRVRLKTEVFSPVALEVDPEAGDLSDGNRVFEPGERVEVAPAWQNNGEFPQVLDGTASEFTGPAGPTYELVFEAADYGEVEPGASASCHGGGMCYRMGIGPPDVARPVLHWDAVFDETLSDETVKTWTLHVGDSFTDVPRASLFYRSVETLLHHGIIAGCGGGAYCPDGVPTRAQMPVFLLRARGRGVRAAGLRGRRGGVHRRTRRLAVLPLDRRARRPRRGRRLRG